MAGSLERRAQLAAAGLWAIVVTDAVAVVADLVYLRYLHSLAPDAKVAELELVQSEIFYALSATAQLLALIFAAVVFIRWFQLAYRNLEDLTDQTPSHHPRWTIWGFFVPFLNLVRPYQLMREIWDVTSSRWDEQQSRAVGLVKPRDHVNLWWGLFLATNFVANLAGRADWRAETAEAAIFSTSAMVFSDAFDIVAAAVALMLIRSVTDLQRPLLGHAPAGVSA